MSMIDNALYLNGRRAETFTTAREAHEALERRGGLAWISLYEPDAEDMAELAECFQLPPLAVEDAINAHQRSKIERYESSIFAVIHPAHYLESSEQVAFGEIHIFVGENYVVTVRHAETQAVAKARKRLEGEPGLLAQGPNAVLYGIFDEVVDEYFPVLDDLENDIFEIEEDLFAGSSTVSQRIYKLSRYVMHLQRVLSSLLYEVQELHEKHQENLSPELLNRMRDVVDHLKRQASRVDSYRDILQNALALDATQTSNRLAETSVQQGEQTKKISAWAAVFFTPTFITGVYGMNFKYMPELDETFGYPISFLAMFLLGFGVWAVFKRKKWL